MSGLPSLLPSCFEVDPDESALIVEARSTAGRISFATTSIEGHLEVVDAGGSLLLTPSPSAELQVDLRTLRSGNTIYDAELSQRLDVRRHPLASVTMEDATRVGDHYQVAGLIELHGRTRSTTGSVAAEPAADGSWVVSGEHAFDIRDFDIAVPSVLMFRIFPDVRLLMSLTLRPTSARPNRQLRA